MQPNLWRSKFELNKKKLIYTKHGFNRIHKRYIGDVVILRKILSVYLTFQ